MFQHISTYHFGRCTKNSDWYLPKSIGINRLYYIHSGHITVLLDNIPHDLQPGHIYLFPQNLKFELLLSEKTAVDHSFFDFFSMPAISMDSLIEIDPHDFPLLRSAAQILFQLGQAYQTYPSMERNDYTDIVESYLLNFLLLLDREYRIRTISDPRINLALDYIHKNYSREITLDELSEVTNLEKNYLIRIFRQYMNATPYQYVKKYRFSIALSLIKRNHPLSEVALQIGYSDIASFSHAFKKNYGISPSEVIGSSTE